MAFPLLADRARESSTTTGTGTLTLSGVAATGFQTFAAAGANGLTVDYTIEAVDANGAPTGEFEVGQGVYTSASNTLTRVTVYTSSNSNALVNFSAGTKNVFITASAHKLNDIAAIAVNHSIVSTFGLPLSGPCLSRGAFVATADTLYAAIGMVQRPMKVSAPQIVVNTGAVASAVARVGMALWDAANAKTQSGALLVDWGTADCSTNGTKSFTSGSTIITLQPNVLYAVLYIAGGGASVPSIHVPHIQADGVYGMMPSGTSLNCLLGYSLAAQGAQRTGGFNSSPFGSTGSARTASVPGQDLFFTVTTADP